MTPMFWVLMVPFLVIGTIFGIRLKRGLADPTTGTEEQFEWDLRLLRWTCLLGTINILWWVVEIVILIFS